MTTKDLRTLRLASGLTMTEVARQAAVTSHQLRQWERGLAFPNRDEVQRLSAVLKASPKTIAQAQRRHAAKAVPGEGYTTAEAGQGEVYPPRQVPSPSKKRVLDLFCGSGGLSFGFEQSGAFVTTAGIDLLPDRIDTFRANHAHATAVAGDLRAFGLDELAKVVGPVDVVVGGPPCQGFSSIRPFRNLTEGDPRNSLVEHYVLVISKLRPAWFVFENVVGILTHERGNRLHAVLEGLRGAGYQVEWRILNAALFGVPQYRERLVIVGNRLGVPFQWPTPTNYIEYKSMAGARPEVLRTDPLFSGHLPAAVTLSDAIGDLPPLESGAESMSYRRAANLTDYQAEMREGSEHLSLHRATNHSSRMLEIIRHSGSNISALPPGMVRSGFSSCYSRLAADRPSTTLTVNFVHPASNRCIHPHQDRALTPREGARIQSFPDRFEFKGTSAQIVKQIGNAVPPKLGRAIAAAIVASEAKGARKRR